jgi:hypothetical protein
MTVLTGPDRQQVHVSGGRTPAAVRNHGRRWWAQRAAAVLLALTAPVMPWAVGAAQAAPSLVGADVSYPQCGTPMPTGQAFAVVGVNGGRPTTTNPCLADQLAWAAQ